MDESLVKGGDYMGECNLYETIIIFKPTGYEKSAEVFYDMCQEFSKSKGFKIINEKIGVKKLAYDIKDFPEGYYDLFTWAGTPENVVELERCMRMNDNVLKFITVRKDETPEEELDAYDPREDAKSEQNKVDAIDVLLGFADYTNNKKEVI